MAELQRYVVAWDPDAVLPEGKVFEDDARRVEARRRGVVLLPFAGDETLIALAPWARFSFGAAVRLSDVTPGYAGRAALWLEPARGSVAWAALLRFPKGTDRAGALRLIGDPRQAPISRAPCGDDARNRADVLKAAHVGDTYAVLEGQAPCQVMSGGIYAFSLYGQAFGCLLAWLAVSQMP